MPLCTNCIYNENWKCRDFDFETVKADVGVNSDDIFTYNLAYANTKIPGTNIFTPPVLKTKDNSALRDERAFFAEIDEHTEACCNYQNKGVNI
jgi:hypothetical protein